MDDERMDGGRRLGQEGGRVRTDRQEGDVTEVEQTGKPDDDVQTECGQRVEAGTYEDLVLGGVQGKSAAGRAGRP